MNVLITSASRKVSLTKTFKAALKRAGGGNVVAVDINSRSPALYEADKSYLVPKTTDKKFLAKIKKICLAENIKLIVPTRDEELLWFAKHKRSLPFIHVASEKTIKLCQNKKAFVRFCKVNNFLTAKTYKVSEVNKIKFPVFVRHQFSKGSLGAKRIDSLRQLKANYTKLNKVVIQQYIAAPEYTVDLMTDFKGRVLSVVVRERIKTFGGESIVGRTVENKLVVDESVRLAKALRLRGHNTIQCFLMSGNVMFIEVNPRFGGGASLGFAAGANSVEMLIRLARGQKVKQVVGRHKKGLVMLRYTKDRFINDKNLIESND